MRLTTKDRGFTRQDRAQRLVDKYRAMDTFDQDAAVDVFLGEGSETPCRTCEACLFDHYAEVAWCVAYAIIDKVDSMKAAI